MNIALRSFNDSLVSDVPPETFSVYLKALWYDRKGQWNLAHNLVDHLDEKEGSSVHAYLHRKEGDASNAAYWYRRAGTEPPGSSLEEEWEMLVTRFMEQGRTGASALPPSVADKSCR